jgi:hypothetical protein
MEYIDDSTTISRLPGIAEYFKSFSELDVHVRKFKNCDTLDGYIAHVVPKADMVGYTTSLAHDVRMAKDLMQLYDDAQGDNMGIGKRELRELKQVSRRIWKIAALADVAEDGYPHTHGDIIFLPLKYFNWPSKKRVVTLLHENIHVYQRQSKSHAEHMAARSRFPLSHLPPHIRYRVRSNPDLDSYVYNSTVTLFDTDHPYKLSDSSLYTVATNGSMSRSGAAFEHPNETMAYELSEAML